MFEPQRRRVGRPKGLTLSQDFGVACREALAGLSEISFPCTQYQTDILGFAEHVLGFKPCLTLSELVAIRDDEDARGVPEHERQKCLWPKQAEILLEVQEAVLSPDEKRVAVASGHKISKSHTAAIIALWFYASFPDAKVVFTSTTYQQVQNILWEEFRKTRHRSKVVIPGDMHSLAASGFVSEDFRTARGFTAREPEAIAGVSGKNLLFLVDEASGVVDGIHEAIAGNMAGGAALVMFSNPTRTGGAFADAFHSKKAFWRTFQVSSEDTPNAQTGRPLIPGLATRAFVEEKRAEYGEDSPWYKIRIKGQFVLNDESKPFSVAVVTDAEERWKDPTLLAEGRLHVSVDPAGSGDGGDQTAFSVRRGNKVLELYTRQSMTEDGIVNELFALVAKHRGPREVLEHSMPVVAIDREGPIGYQVWLRFKARAEAQEATAPIRIVGVRASSKAYRRPDLYHLVRDELWANLEAWLKSGGAIPTDTKLEKELDAIEWTTNLRGQLKATSKDEIREKLGRSPDRADALCLVVWEPSGHGRDPDDASQDTGAAQTPPTNERTGAFDPYAAQAFDPYAGL